MFTRRLGRAVAHFLRSRCPHSHTLTLTRSVMCIASVGLDVQVCSCWMENCEDLVCVIVIVYECVCVSVGFCVRTGTTLCLYACV